MPTLEELQAADTSHGRAQLQTLLLEFSTTLARLPNLERELRNWLAQGGQEVDYTTLSARAEAVLVMATDWLLDYDHLSIEVRQTKAMQDFMQTVGDTVTCRTMAVVVQKFEEIECVAEQVAMYFNGWQKHGLNGEVLDVTAQQWAALTDKTTGLMWAVNCGRVDFPNRGNLTVDDAHAWVKQVNQQGWCGYRDWRLPRRKELKTLLQPRNGIYNRTHYQQLFTEAFADQIFWTSSLLTNISHYAWVVNFYNGKDDDFNRYSCYNVRLMRVGQ